MIFNLIDESFTILCFQVLAIIILVTVVSEAKTASLKRQGEDASQAKIIVYHNGLPTDQTLFDYYFLTENGIKQDVTGKITI